MMDDFTGGVAVITGGASGIGFGLASKLVDEGMRIVIADIETAALEKAAEGLRAKGADVLAVQCDVSDRSEVEALAINAYEHFGNVNFLANNAGVVSRHKAWDAPDDWDWVLGIDLMGVVYGVQSFVPRMLASGEPGHVLNTASTAGLLAFPGIASYNVAKRGVVALSETLHHEFKGSALSVSVLCPGMVDTNIGTSERNREGVDFQPHPEKFVVSDANENLTPDEVAEIVVDEIRQGIFWILPHKHYGNQALEQANRRISGGGPVLPHIDR
tara:strand:- start:1713 stop:2528 length:816 start_codon:yes stop_codon:yes gene_type:complete